MEKSQDAASTAPPAPVKALQATCGSTAHPPEMGSVWCGVVWWGGHEQLATSMCTSVWHTLCHTVAQMPSYKPVQQPGPAVTTHRRRQPRSHCQFLIRIIFLVAGEDQFQAMME